MKKIFTLLTLLMFIGGGKTWADPTYKNDFTNGQIIWTTKANVDDAISAGWMAKGGNMPDPKNLKNKMLMDPATDAIATTAPFTSNTYFYVEKVYNSNSSSDQSLYIYVTGVARIFFYAWCNSSPDGRTMDITVNGVASGTISFASGTNNAQYTSVILTKSANNIIRINGSNEVELTAIKVETVEKSISSLTFASTSGTGDIADGTSFTLPSLTKNPVDATVTYSSSNEAAATVNPSTGAVTLVAPGVTTITASYAGDASYYPSTATYELTVVNTAANNITVTYDVSGVVGLEGTAPESFNIDEGDNFTIPVNQSLYVDGKTLTGWEYNSTTYAIGADMTAAATDMTLTPVFTANGASTYLGHNASTATWNFNNNTGAPTWNMEGSGTFVYVTQTTIGGNSMDVKMNMDATGGKIYSNGDWTQINANSKLTVPVIVGAVVKVYVYSSAAAPTFNGNDGAHDSENNIYSYTATADGDIDIVYGGNDYASKVTVEYPSESAVLTVSAANTTVGLTQAIINSVDYLTAATDNWSSSQTIDDYTGKFYNLSSTDRNLTVKVTGASLFEVYVKNNTANRTYKVKVGSGDAQIITHGGTGVESSGVFAIADPTVETTITISGGGNGSVYPGYIVFNPAVSVEIGTYEWATFCDATHVLDFSGVSGLTAYQVIGASGSSISKSPITGSVAAGTGLLLNGAAGTYYIPITNTATEDVSGNKLVGVTSDTDVNFNDGASFNYVLGVEGGKAMFQQIVDGTYGTVNVPAGKAYLALTSNPGLARVLDLDGDVTAIKDIKVGTEDNVYYDLQGRRVLYPTKGLYIVNGKKVIIK